MSSTLPLQFDVLILSGPVGVGKTTVGKRLSQTLRTRMIFHALIDLDSLSAIYPRDKEDPFGQNLGLINLRAIWPNYEQRGAIFLIISTVVDNVAVLEQITKIFGDKRVGVCQLTASMQILVERLSQREKEGALEWSIDRAISLKNREKDFPADITMLTDDKDPYQVAEQLLEWLSSGA